MMERDVIDRVRSTLPFAEVAAAEGVELRRQGARWVGLCPFHQEKSGSFTTGGRFPDRGHCFGCGWDGDVFKFVQDLHGLDFPASVRRLAERAGLQVDGADHVVRPPRPRVATRPLPEVVRPALPPLRRMLAKEVAALARIRGLSFDGVAAAAWRFRRVAFSQWPLFYDGAGWQPRAEVFPSWCVTDDARWVGEFRRLDGGLYPLGEGREIKAWSTAGKAWPVGAEDVVRTRRALLVEGGPDMLAGFHFLHRFGMLDAVSVVAMLGAANKIRGDALGFFDGARVRIIMHADAAGLTAAARWTSQLTEAGAAVEAFSLVGLSMKDGWLVNDLNDLAHAADTVIDGEEVAEAFTEWKEGWGG